MKKIVIAAACMLITLISAGLVFAGNDFLSPEADRVEAGQQLGFAVKLPERVGDVPDAYTIVIGISPEEPEVNLRPKESVDVTRNYSSGTYSIKSADLQGLDVIRFELTPDPGISEETEYRVEVNIIGTSSTDTDAFAFTAIPRKQPPEDKPEKEKLGKGNFGIGAGGETGDGSGNQYRGDADNYLKSLVVSGYEFSQKFDKTRDTYFIKTEKSVSKLMVSAVPCDSTARVDIAGNNNVSKNMSKIIIDVTADNGDVRTYKIYVTHLKDDGSK